MAEGGSLGFDFCLTQTMCLFSPWLLVLKLFYVFGYLLLAQNFWIANRIQISFHLGTILHVTEEAQILETLNEPRLPKAMVDRITQRMGG